MKASAHKNMWYCLLGSSMLAAHPSVALAQDGTAASKADSGEYKAAEIIVTAQKRSQRLQDVAASISALSAQDLKTQGISTVSEIAARIPGLEFGQNAGSTFTVLRGVGAAIGNGIAEPAVATYVDGIFLPRSTMATLAPIDLARIEVVRGPQGTLYGRNATGGAINFISLEPTEQLSGTAQVGYGNYQTFEAKGAISGSISEGVRARLSAGYTDRGKGYFKNIIDGSTLDKIRRASVRGAVVADITETLKATVSLDYQHERFQVVNKAVTLPTAFSPSILPPGTVIATKPYEVSSDFTPWSTRSTLIGRGQLDWEISPDVSLKSITGYVKHKFAGNGDFDYTSASIETVTNRAAPSEAYSQEFDLGGSLPNRGSWLVGANYYHEAAQNNFPIRLPAGVPGYGIPPNTLLVFDMSEKTTTLALFGDATLGLSDRFRLYGGARIALERKQFVQTQGARIPGVPEAFTLGCNNKPTDRSYTFFTPRVGAQYDVVDGVMAYAQFSRGAKSGGLNQGQCDQFFEPERLNAYEGGLKTQFLDRRVTLNTAFFHYGYNNFQVLQIVGAAASVANAKARVTGAEAELSIQANDVFRFDASFTWLDAKFVDFQSVDTGNAAAGLQNLKGQRLPRSPKYSGSVGAEARIPLALGLFESLTLRADMRWSDGMYFQPFNRAAYEQKSYATVNLNAVLAQGDDGFSIRAYGRNITNKAVANDALYNAIIDMYSKSFQPPRTYGVEISYSF